MEVRMNPKHISAFIFTTLFISILLICSCESRQEVRAASSAQPVAVKPFRQIGVEEFLRVVEKNPGIQIVDVRPANQHDMAYIHGSKNIPLENLEGRIPRTPQGRE
jgi:hypothetical protein